MVPTMAERVRGLEVRTECLPSLLDDVDQLKRKRERDEGRDNVLRWLVLAVLGSPFLTALLTYYFGHSH